MFVAVKDRRRELQPMVDWAKQGFGEKFFVRKPYFLGDKENDVVL